jgi:hypothetical protein
MFLPKIAILPNIVLPKGVLPIAVGIIIAM